MKNKTTFKELHHKFLQQERLVELLLDEYKSKTKGEAFRTRLETLRDRALHLKEKMENFTGDIIYNYIGKIVIRDNGIAMVFDFHLTSTNSDTDDIVLYIEWKQKGTVTKIERTELKLGFKKS